MSQSTFAWTTEQLATATHGQLIGANIAFSRVITDSREITVGDLYVAIKGPNFDGHVFAEAAQLAGASAILVSERQNVDIPQIVVTDTRIALGQFGQWHRMQMPVQTLVGITGSNGKTTTKTMIAQIMSSVANTIATQGNLNNDFGVPRTLLQIRPENEFAVVEMGANHEFEIRYLTSLVNPDIALLNNAAEAHLEGFGSLEGVIRAKGEIFEGLNPDNPKSCAVINADSAGFADWQQKLHELSIDNVCVFGAAAKGVHVGFKNVQNTPEGVTFELQVKGVKDVTDFEDSVLLPLVGLHHAANACAATAVCLNAGLSWEKIKAGLQSFNGVSGRLTQYHLQEMLLIDDSYNANPASMRAAIDTLSAYDSAIILCLGAMAELGEDAKQAHQDILNYAIEKGIKKILLYGALWEELELGKECRLFAEHSTMAQFILKRFNKNKTKTMTVLVKGSRSSQMDKVVVQLRETISG